MINSWVGHGTVELVHALECLFHSLASSTVALNMGVGHMTYLGVWHGTIVEGVAQNNKGVCGRRL